MPDPTLNELTAALATRVGEAGVLEAADVRALVSAPRWGSRLADLAQLVAGDDERLGYLAGGHRPEEVARCLLGWLETPLTLSQIQQIIECGGWDPDPFTALAEAGLLDRVLRGPDGNARRIRGELAGGWVSDNLALADGSEIVARALAVVDDEAGPGGQDHSSAPRSSEADTSLD
ncbi:MAG TPA: hypothetical protein VKU92_00995 [Acidimicrobiales bacterium]|nr:hypothetical protein [Acidimicrobiales bacterium]